MNDQIEEEKDSFLERGKYTGISSSTENERKLCIQESDHEEEHASSLKNNTTHCQFEEINPENSGSEIEQPEVKTVRWLQGNIETRYNENQGFQHVVKFDTSNKAASTLKLRNSDQLLDINDEDVTLMSHNEVSELVDKIPSNGNTTLSDEIAAYFLFVLKEVGVVDVPSLKQLKDFNTTGLNVENMIVKNEDKDGNLFWTVKPSALIGLAVANPNTACTLKRYPEKNPTKDAGHAGSRKWKEEIDFHWGKKKNGDCIYLGEYVKHGHQIGKVINFISMISEGQSCLTIVMQLVKINPQELDCYNDDRQNSTGICLITGNMVEYPIDECELMDLAIIENISFMKKINGDYINCTQQDRDLMLEVSPFKISNLPVVTVPINIFIDDTSANKSRRWDALHCIQTQLAGIPLKDKQRNRNVMVLGTSDKVAILDIAKPICDDILSLKSSGIRGFDAMTKENIMITSDVNCIIADYNCVSLVCNHLGPSANKFCPKCMADSSDPLSFEWEKRTPNKTQRTIEHIKIARNKVEIRKENGVKEHTNCFWEIINCHKDTPTGLLHFMYLGLVKHLVQLCLTKLSEQQKEKLELHLNSLNLTSFPYPVNGKFIKYVDSRQGKDFKTYVQVAFFNMEYVRLPMKYLQAISALAMMSKHIHTTEGTETVDKDIKNYIAIIKEKIPELSSKKKTHLCMHLIDDIKEHGCLLEYSEDAFEKNHGLIRSEIFIQNQLAKSRDTAAQFSRNAILEHIISGGYFLDNNNWIQASQQVQSFGRVNIVEKFMGKGNETKGKFTLSKLEKKDNLQKLSDLQILQAFVNCGLSISSYNEQCTVTQFFGNALTKSGERATLGGYVLYLEEEEIYWRRSSKSVTDVKFSLYEVQETFVVHLHHHSMSPDSTKIFKRTVVWSKHEMLKFMQPLGKQSNIIVFKELVSKIPNKKPCDFFNSHFLEERILEEKGTYRRRYSTTSQNGEKKYLHVTDAGDLILVHKSGKLSNFAFKLRQAQLSAFFVLNEIPTNRCMKLEGDEGKFVCVNYNQDIDRIGDDFRFDLQKCNHKRTHMCCMIT